VQQQFDYVIVGGGSAGSVMAGRLSEDASLSVALLETGGKGDSWVVKAPIGTVAMMPTPLNNYAYDTVPQAGLDGRKGYQPRGKMLGGSSGLNAMVYIRGHRVDYDHWAALGNAGWSYDDMLPYFKRSENNANLGGEYHGQAGPLHVSHLQTDNPFHETYLTAARQVGYPINSDFNGPEQEGIGIYQVTQKNGERWSAARGYLHPYMGVRPNLSVRTGLQARRVVFEGKRAIGVEVLQGGQLQLIRARREVILCGGAFGSPQLLMLSGVGPAAHLRQHGIDVVHDLPGVGQNLQDHPDFILSYYAKSLDLMGFSPRGLLRQVGNLWRYVRTRRGMFSTNFAEGGGFLRSEPGLAAPDLQLHFCFAIVDDHARKLHARHGYSCHVCLLRPTSRGSVTLRSADPAQAPNIDPAFLATEEDMAAMVKGFRITRKLMEAPALKQRRHRELYSEGVESDEQIRALLRQRVDSVYHPVGTCKMGSDALAVVDAELKVHGLQGLRVVDASIMPTLIGGNTNAPTIAIAEKAIDMIRAATSAKQHASGQEMAVA
jgi:choline dehydrogenase-like flavoprotein